jgi:hypothetical protein
MNLKELKIALDSDVKILRQLDPEIVPGSFYYGNMLKYISCGLFIFWIIITLTIAYAGVHNPSNDGLADETVNQILKEAALMAFFMSLGVVLILSQGVSFYILFRFHLEKKLRTAPLLIKKFNQIAGLFLIVFMLFCAMFASYGESAAIFMMIGFAFFGSLIVTYFLVSIELNRIGVSLIFTAINEFFSKGRNIALPPN